MNDQSKKTELLGNAPIPKALLAMGIPTMIGMLINALYNLVDAYFVGGLGESQMAAISVVYPLGQVVVGLGLLFGNGAASYISRLLGQKNRDQANKVASTALYSSLFIGAIIIALSIIFLKPILRLLGATESILPYLFSSSVTFKKTLSFREMLAGIPIILLVTAAKCDGVSKPANIAASVIFFPFSNPKKAFCI